MSEEGLPKSLTRLARLIADGTVRSEAVVERALEAQRVLEPSLGAYCATRREEALAEARVADDVRLRFGARGPLHGIPVSVKDHFGVRGMPCYAGTSRELPDRFRREGPVVRRLRQQLGIVVGKTVAVELAFGGIGTNPHWGSPRNPWDAEVDRVSGGSSAGAGVSLLQGSAWLALGTDTAGSCRIPASMTGVVGLKTTRGRWPTGGVVPLSSTLDTVGLLGRTVSDVGFGFHALDSGRSTVWEAVEELEDSARGVPSLVLGVVREQLWEDASPGVVEAVEQGLRELEAAGVRVVDVSLPEARTAEAFLRAGSVASAELDAFLEVDLPGWRDLLDPTVSARIADGADLSAREYLLRLRSLETLARDASKRFDGVDALVCPTVPNTPPPVSALHELPVYRRENFLALRNTCVASFCGLCALTLPVGRDAVGLPVGLQVLAPGGAEEDLLRIGAALEDILGGAADRIGSPPRCAVVGDMGRT